MEQPDARRLHPLGHHRLPGAQHKNYWVTLIPALFMTVVCTTFFFSVQAFKLDDTASAIVAVVALLVSAVWFTFWKKKNG